MITTIFLCRHGAVDNPKDVLYGRLPGFHLSSEGKNQAVSLGEQLKKFNIAAIYSSPLTRTIETGQIISTILGIDHVTCDNRLEEIKSPYEGKPNAWVDRKVNTFYTPEYLALGGESLETIFERMDSFVQEAAKRYTGSFVVAVSHGDPIMIVNALYQGKPHTSASVREEFIDHAQCIRVIVDEHGKIVVEKGI
jgi:broad specificity phosphatase PhoE